MAGEDVEFGYVVDTTLGETSGTELVADAAIGATSLVVDYAGDFEDSGELVLNGEVLAYTSIVYGDTEADPDVIALAVPLATAALTDDKVGRMAGGEPVRDWLLHVSQGDGHTADIPIPFEQRASWETVDTSVPIPVFVSSDLERLVEVPGRPQVIDGASIDTSTLPPVPGGQTISDVAPTDTTGYPEDYGWWQVVDGEVLGFWRLVAGVWTSQAVVTMEALQANNVLVEALDGVTVTGVTVQTRGEPERGFKAGYIGGVEGLFVYNESGVPFLKAVPEEGMAVIAGEVKANSLTVAPTSAEEGTSLGGVTEIVRHADGTAGVLRLTGYTTPPKSAPTVTTSYDTVQFTDDGHWGSRRGWATDGTYWFTHNAATGQLEKWTAAGVKDDEMDSPDGVGCAYGGGKVYVLSRFGSDWRVAEHDSATLAAVKVNTWTHADGGDLAAIGYDAATSDILIAQSRPSDVTIPNRVRIRRYTFAAGFGFNPLVAGASVDTDFAYSGDLAGVSYGTHDFGANRYVLAKDNATSFQVASSTGALVAAEEWQSGMAAKVGFAYTGGAFKSMDTSGLMRTYTGQDKATAIGGANLTKYVSNTLANATLETTQSPRAKITIPKRTKINITTSAINTGGTNAPDRVKVYIGQGSTDPTNTNMIKQTDPSVGQITISYSAIATSPDTNPPTVNGFAAAAGTVQQVQLADESVFLDGVGGPAWKTTWTPAWTTTGTAPAIGNGTLTGRYQRIGGNAIAFSVQLTAGSTTTFGTGSWRFNFPVAELARRWAFQGTLRDASAAADFDAAVVRVSSGVLQVNCDPTTAGASTRGVTNAIPFAWGDGDILFFSGVFEVA